MNILVTGSAGFIGSHLVQRLVDDGHNVTGFDNFSNGFRENVDRISGDHRFVEGDLRDPADCAEAVRDVEIVFHEGALGSVPRSIESPHTSYDVNVMGTVNLLAAARDAGVRRVIYASSSSVYGDSKVSPKHEGLVPGPLSPYAVTKLAAEQSVMVFGRTYGMESVALRYFNVFGPHQNPSSQYAAVIPKFLVAITSGDRPTVFGDGEQSRGFTYIDNVIEGNLLAATVNEADGHIMNLAADTTETVNTVLRLIGERLGVDPNPNYVDPRPGDIRDSLADVSPGSSVLGWGVTVPFEEGLERTVDAFIAERDQ